MLRSALTDPSSELTLWAVFTGGLEDVQKPWNDCIARLKSAAPLPSFPKPLDQLLANGTECNEGLKTRHVGRQPKLAAMSQTPAMNARLDDRFVAEVRSRPFHAGCFIFGLLLSLCHQQQFHRLECSGRSY